MYTNEIKGEITPIQQQLIFFIKKKIFSKSKFKKLSKSAQWIEDILLYILAYLLNEKKNCLIERHPLKKMSDCLSSPDAVYKTLACR